LLCSVLTPLAVSIVPTPCSSEHIARAIRATTHCKPVLKVVKLDIPGNGSFTQMTPLHVSAHLCGGGCHTASHSCVSTGQTTLHIPVLLSSCGLTSGICSKTCSTVAIQEDTACRCDCLKEQETCTRDRQAFNTNSCMCECKEEEEYSLCRDKGRVWDYKECVCSCPLELVKPCSTGFIFDYTSTCSCVPEHAKDISNIVTEARVERSEAGHNFQHVEMIIIIALGMVVSVFFIVIINLLSSVRTLRSTVTRLREELGGNTPFISSEQSLLTK